MSAWPGGAVSWHISALFRGLTQAPPTRASSKIEIRNALLAMATGGFDVYHLDNARPASVRPERGSSAPRAC